MAKPAVTAVVSFPYQGTTEEWSNQFHFTGSAPTDTAGWDALCAAFIAKYRPLLWGNVVVRRIYCYTDSDNDSVYTYDLALHGGTLAGTLVLGGSAQPVTGDSAYWVRWSTGRHSSTGKAIYLRKYFHPGFIDPPNLDAMDSTARTNLLTAANAIAASSGAWPGMAGPTYDVSSPIAAVCTYVTTRTLKRRGKRP